MIKVYADASARFATQLALDVLFVGWVVTWVWIGNAVHDGTLALREPGERIESSATGLAESMTEAGSFLSDVPLVGSGAATPFEKASQAADSLAAAGRAEVEAVERLAFWLGVAIAAVPILVVSSRYLPGRVRFAREATAGQRFVDAEADEDLFALRAIARQPMHVLAGVSHDPVGDWRRGDRDVVRRLAALELREVGLRPPR